MSNDAHDPITLISYEGGGIGSSSGNRCGYCKTSSGRHIQYLSGSLLYKPHMKITCCPQYTVRLDTQEFKPSRDQRQCLHKWSRYILGEDYIQEAAKKFPKSKDEKKKQRSEFNLIESVHAPEYLTIKHQTPPDPTHKLEVNLEPANFTEEKYALFENYQRNVHHEPSSDISRSGFKRFLCTSPLESSTTAYGTKFGSFHQCYRIDEQLVAMSVLDLLPHCVSGVYFIYHEDYAKWSFGKLSACREAVLAKEGGYRYYYMGYYIQSCPKMLYKGEYGPSDLLDPETYEWNPLDQNLKKLLDESKYVCPSAIRARQRLGESQATSEANEGVVGDVEVTGGDGTDEDTGEDQATGFVFETNMPGVLTNQQLEAFDIGNVKIKVDGVQGRAKDLVGFGELTGLHTVFRETVATVGTEVAREMVLVLR